MHVCVWLGGGGGVRDGRPHGEGLLSLSLSAHLTAAVAGLPKARPQARASCGPPAGFTSLPEPIRAPLLSTSAQEAPTQPCSPLPLDAIALCPALLRTEITLLFSTVCHVVSVIGAVWGHVFCFYLFFCLCLPCPRAARFQNQAPERLRLFQWCGSISGEQIAVRPFYGYYTNVARLLKLRLCLPFL